MRRKSLSALPRRPRRGNFHRPIPWWKFRAPAAPARGPPDMLKANDALLSARDVTLNLNGRLILDRVNLDVRRGEIVTVIGPNGAGKSTLARVMLGLRPLTSGRI